MSPLRTERDGRVVVATFDNPPHQLLDSAGVTALEQLVAEADSDPEIGAVVLTGAHPERFLAHYDVAELLGAAESAGVRVSSGVADVALKATGALSRVPGGGAALRRTPAAGLVQVREFHELLLRMGRSGVVYIAALNGSVMGGGCELSLACDLRYMADGDFAIGQPEVLLGIVPGGGGTQRLTRLIGASLTIEMILEGFPLTPRQAMEYGLVHRIVAPERLLDEALATAHRLARRPRAAVAAAKRLVYEGGTGLTEGLAAERAELMATLVSADARELMRRFVDEQHASGELPSYDPVSRQRLLDGTF